VSHWPSNFTAFASVGRIGTAKQLRAPSLPTDSPKPPIGSWQGKTLRHILRANCTGSNYRVLDLNSGTVKLCKGREERVRKIDTEKCGERLTHAEGTKPHKSDRIKRNTHTQKEANRQT
jgi:hypothetical protein